VYFAIKIIKAAFNLRCFKPLRFKIAKCTLPRNFQGWEIQTVAYGRFKVKKAFKKPSFWAVFLFYV